MSQSVPRLRFVDFAPASPFYAILLTLVAPTSWPPGVHNHDFFELTWMGRGEGVHYVNGESVAISQGDLMLVRPDDVHSMVGKPFATAINVAFPRSSWLQQGAMLGLEAQFAELEQSVQSPCVTLSGERCAACSHIFERLLSVPPGNDLEMAAAFAQLWVTFLDVFMTRPAGSPLPNGPDWLARGLQLMELGDNLRGGVPRLVKLCAVCPEHLARVMRRDLGQTPTEWVTAARLRVAAHRLLTTNDSIGDIADFAGFGHLNHFYRVFTAQYGVPPRQFRQRSRKAIIPSKE